MAKIKTKPVKTAAKQRAPFGADRWIVTKAKYLRMLAPFVSKEETRYYLHGIHVEPAKQGIILVATDGHRMGIIHDVDGSAKSPFICAVSKGALAYKAREDALAVFSGQMLGIVPAQYARAVKGPKTAISYAEYIETLGPVDGTYPEWRKVVPAEIKHRLRPLSFNARYVADFAKVIEAAGKKTDFGAGFNFYQTGGPTDPVVARTPAVPEFVGLLMPMRVDSMEPLPTWLAKKAA